MCSNNVSNFSQNFYCLIIRFITKILQATETDYNYLCMKCLVTIIIMSLSELHDDLLNNILVFLQLAVNGETDNIFLMVSLRA